MSHMTLDSDMSRAEIWSSKSKSKSKKMVVSSPREGVWLWAQILRDPEPDCGLTRESQAFNIH